MISSITYSGDGANRIFPVSFEIKGEEYVAVFINDVGVSDKTKYDIINNSIVFIEEEAPIVGVDNVVISVATTPSEIADLGAPPSGVQTVLDNLVNINKVATIDNDVTTVADNSGAVTIVATNATNINSIVTTIVPNISEILLADTNAAIATTQAGIAIANATISTTQAGIATTQASNALTSANNADVSEANALTSANNADVSEANALSYSVVATTKASEASTSATTATTQATIATTQAGEASTSATLALGYKNEAEGFRDEAEAFADSIDTTNFVNTITAQTVAGIKTFSSSPIIPNATTATQAIAFGQAVNLTAAQTVAGIKTFSSSPIVPTPTTLTQAASKGYVDGLNTTWVANDSRAKTALNASGTAPIYACRAWVNFNGTGTVAIRASGNVSSITDNGTGDYTVNFTTAMPDTNYSMSPSAGSGGGTQNTVALGQTMAIPTTTSVRFVVTNINTSLIDAAYVNTQVFR